MSAADRAGQPALPEDLIDVSHVVTAYYAVQPDPDDVDQQVAFGTSGHRGSSLKGSFNEWHILATTQAICDYRREVFFKDICLPYICNVTNLRNYLVQTLQRFYQHIIQPKNIAFMRMFLEQSQNNTDLAHYLYNKCAMNIQNSVSLALEQAHHSGEIFCEKPQFSATMYFGILRDVEWRILMGLDVPAEDKEIFDYIDFSVDLFLKAHQKV